MWIGVKVRRRVSWQYFWIVVGHLGAHALRGRRARSKTGAICAYKLGALGDRSAELKPEKERQL
jgi:hypothetical protein